MKILIDMYGGEPEFLTLPLNIRSAQGRLEPGELPPGATFGGPVSAEDQAILDELPHASAEEMAAREEKIAQRIKVT